MDSIAKLTRKNAQYMFEKMLLPTATGVYTNEQIHLICSCVVLLKNKPDRDISDEIVLFLSRYANSGRLPEFLVTALARGVLPPYKKLVITIKMAA